MRAYTYSEIGMLVGAAVGGCLATTGYVLRNDPWYFTVAAAGIIAGITIGNYMERKYADKNDKGVRS